MGRRYNQCIGELRMGARSRLSGCMAVCQHHPSVEAIFKLLTASATIAMALVVGQASRWYGRHRIALVELTCPWDTDAKRAKECKASRYADLKTAFSNEGWDCSLYMIEVGAWAIFSSQLRTTFGRYSRLGSLQAIG
jgi:hypothetical protein